MIADPRIDPRLADDVDKAEANELIAYLDTESNWSIGRGHLLPKAAPGRDWVGFSITTEVSDRYFLGDLLNALSMAQKLPEWASMDTPCRQNALTEICFNLGGHWEGFHDARDAALAKNWPVVADQMLNTNGHPSEWHIQVGQRAERLAQYMLTGAYP